jgi:hypothetical protein
MPNILDACISQNYGFQGRNRIQNVKVTPLSKLLIPTCLICLPNIRLFLTSQYHCNIAKLVYLPIF